MWKVSRVNVLKRNFNVFNKLDKRKYSVDLPSQADVVIIGGGVTGCSTLYQLSKRGINAVLLERGKLTCGTTWHTGALVWSLRPNDVDIQIMQKTRDLLVSLEKETGLNTGWINCGGLFIARTEERLEEYKRLHTLGHCFNIQSNLLSPLETSKLSPIIDPKSLVGALYAPEDGYTDPSMYCSALVKGATSKGGQVFENCAVTNILADTSSTCKKVVGVETTSGTIKTKCVVNAAGSWGPKIARLVGFDLPVVSFKHSYVLTGSIPEAKGTPAMRDHDGSLYIRTSGDSILMGGYENNPVLIKELPDDFQFGSYEADGSALGDLWNHACKLCPSLEKVGIKSTICGPESFTPDHKPVMGEDPKVIGLFHSCGFNSMGMMLSGGCSEQLALWIDKGVPDLHMRQYDIRRFTNLQRTDKIWYAESTHESYINSYGIVYPHGVPLAGRNYKINPFHENLVACGAIMEPVQKWERPSHFIKDRTAPVRGYDWYGNYDHIENTDKRYVKEVECFNTFDFGSHHELVREECLATRNNVALFDISSRTKMYLTGPDAAEAADWLLTANMDQEPGKVIDTLALTNKGGIAAELIVIPLQEGTGTLVGPILKGKGYYIIADDATGHDQICHLKRELVRKNFKAVINDSTDRLGILSINGPKSGELLQSITESPITDEKLPYGMSQLIKIIGHTCRVLRISYPGELGYELHIPTASCLPIFHKIIDAGRAFDLKLAGFRALESLSCEKGNHLANYDIRTDDNPVEASLTHACREEGQYLGRPFVEKAKKDGVSKKRVFFTLTDKVPIHGLETIWRDDTAVGFLRRGEYAFSLDCSMGIGYVKHPKGQKVDDEFLRNGHYKIEIRNKRYPATIHLKSPFDPTGQRLLGIYENEFEEQAHVED